MKKMGKSLSVLIALAMLILTLPQAVLAADATIADLNTLAGSTNCVFSSGWYIARNNNKVTDMSGAFKPIPTGHTGNYALWVNSTDTSGNVIDLRNTGITSLPASTYTLKFWAVGTLSASWRFRVVGPFGSGYVTGDAANKPKATGNTQNGWTEYSTSFTLASAVNCVHVFELNGVALNVAFDDFSLTDANGTEYIVDGGFENSTRPLIEVANELASSSEIGFSGAWTVTTTGSYSKANITPVAISHSGNYSTLINWTGSNGTNLKLTNSGFNNIVSGKTYTLSFWGLNIASYKSWRCRVLGTTTGNGAGDLTAGATENGWTKYSVTFTAGSGRQEGYLLQLESNGSQKFNYTIDDVELYCSEAPSVNLIVDGGFESSRVPTSISDLTAAADETTYTFSNNWTISTTGSYTSSNIKTVPVGHNGTYSALINWVGSNQTVLDLKNSGATLVAGKQYTLSFWGININSYKSWRFKVLGTTTGAGAGNLVQGATEFGWTKYSVTFTAGTSVWTDFVIRLDSNGSQSFCYGIDDVELYCADAPTVNMIADGGFENSVIEAIPDTIADANKDVENVDYVLGDEWYTSGDTNNHLIRATNVAHTGDFAALVDYTGNADGNYIMLKNTGAPETLAPGTYVLTFWGLNIESYKEWRFRIGTLDARNLTATGDAEDGWKKYQISFTVADTGMPYLMQFFSSGTQRFNYAIDDMSLKLSGSDTELLADGGFEDSVGLERDMIHPFAYPVQAGGAVNVSWTNPDVKNITEIKVLVNDTPYSFTANKEPSAFNECLVTGLTNGTEYTFKIQATMNGLSNESIVVGTPGLSGSSQTLSNWNVVSGTETSNTFNNAITYIDSEKGIMVTEGNIIKDANEIAKIKIGQNGTDQTLSSDKAYKLEFLAKPENVDSMYLEVSSEAGDAVQEVFISTATNSDWQGYECIIEPLEIFDVYDYTVYIVIDGLKGRISFDEMFLNEIDEFSSEDLTGNLFENPSFAETTAPDYIVYEPTFDLMNGSRVEQENLENIACGKIRITAKAKNNKMGDNFEVLVLAALYDGDNLLYLENILDSTVPQTYEGVAPEVYTGNINVPELTNGDYSIKVFYWNGFDLKALGRAYNLTEIEE